MVSEPESVRMDTEFRYGVYNTLAYHESRSDHFNNKLDQIINTLQTLLTKLQSSRIPHNANTQTKPEIIAISSSSSSMATEIEYSYNTHTHSSSKVTPFAVVYGVPNPNLLSYIPGTTKVNSPDEILCDCEDTLADLLRNPFLARNREQFRHRNLPTPTRAASSVAFKLHHTVHYISSTAVTTAVVPLPVFDPGGNGSFEEEGVARLQAWWNFSHFGRIFEGFRRQIGKSDRRFSEKRRIGNFLMGIEDLERSSGFKKIWGFLLLGCGMVSVIWANSSPELVW